MGPEEKGAVCPLGAKRLTPEDIFEQMKGAQDAEA
jgi:hypothetical protein